VKVILDMDPGIDDAVALTLALSSPGLEVLGVTAVAGNVPVERAGSNARRVLEYIGRGEVPVYLGASRPLARPLRTAEHVHGADGLGEAGIPGPREPPVAGAVGFIAERLRESPGEITIIATGPLTNIASTLLLYPATARLVKEIILMGGAYHLTPYGRGNATPLAEFNIYADPEAADVVFSSGIPLICVGLDVTANPSAKMGRARYSELASSRGAKAELAARVSRYQLERLGEVELHDAVAVAFAVRPEILSVLEAEVKVLTGCDEARGATVVRRVETGGAARHLVAVDIDGEAFWRLLLDSLSRP